MKHLLDIVNKMRHDTQVNFTCQEITSKYISWFKRCNDGCHKECVHDPNWHHVAFCRLIDCHKFQELRTSTKYDLFDALFVTFYKYNI